MGLLGGILNYLKAGLLGNWITAEIHCLKILAELHIFRYFFNVYKYKNKKKNQLK